MSLPTRSVLWLWLGTAPLIAMGCQRRPHEVVMPQLSPQQLADVKTQQKAWRAHQDARMRGPLSPLARVDYQDLSVGEHKLSRDPAATVHLPPALWEGFAGELRFLVSSDGVHFASTSALAHNDMPSTSGTMRKGDTLSIGRARLLLSGAATDPGLAVYDERAPARLAYSGLHYYPDSDAHVTAAKLLRSTPHPVKLLASRGEPQELTAIGELHFALEKPCVLEAYLESPGSDTLFLIFRDQTSAQPDGSYGAGRFLLAKLASDDTAILDFNQAWNPLCAYSPYFHCPMPSRKNHLPVAITAGEKSYGDH